MLYSKKIAAFFLLFSFMLSGTIARELKKMPELVDHYYDHRQEDRKTDLLSFLFMHYCSEDGTDKDAAEDSRLPFKSAESPAAFSFAYLPLRPVCSLEKPVAICNTTCFDPNDAFISSLDLDSIWQPPRSAWDQLNS